MRKPLLGSWAAALATLTLFAGCVGGSAEQSVPQSGLDPQNGSTVLGVVISDELFPVEGANVTLVDLATTFTDAAGRFVFEGVPEGAYQLDVTAEGYEPHSMELDMATLAGEVRIGLTGIPGKAPYVRTIIHDGFSVCAISAVYSAQQFPPGVPCQLGTPKGGPKVEVGEDWVSGVHELAWRTQEDMIFASSVGTEDLSHGSRRAGCITNGVKWDWCPAMIWGKSPLRIFARPNDTEYAAKYAIDGKETWPGGENYTSWIFSSYSGYLRNEVNQTGFPVCAEINSAAKIPRSWGCPFGIGYSLGIKLTYYHTTFYLQPPGGRLEEFTAMPDG